jgi:large subunit ribosomal protein L21
MYAVIATGGKQYRVSEGDEIFVEKLAGEVDDILVFGDVLTVVNDGDVKVGTPFLDGAKVTAKVLKQGKDKKILVFKYKSKANYRRRQGHRQPYTKVAIEKIEA